MHWTPLLPSTQSMEGDLPLATSMVQMRDCIAVSMTLVQLKELPASMCMVSIPYSDYYTPIICFVLVLGRAVFASCPPGGCANNPTSLSVEDGGSVNFDASVIHTPGGSCDFRQEIDTVQLTRLNPVFGVDDDQLLSCATSEVSCGNSKASLSRGNDPGYEFVFTLNNASLERDNRTFRVSVHLMHPATASTEQIVKDFVLQGNVCSCFLILCLILQT